MAEQTFKSPNFFETETDLSAPQALLPTGIPAGVIGTSNRGPAFVPVTVAGPGMDQFNQVFGGLDPRHMAPYAVNEWLKYNGSLTFIRVLGAGANKTSSDISTTNQKGRVKNAGFSLPGVAAPHDTTGRHAGVVQFIAAKHTLMGNETYGMPMFTDNNSWDSNNLYMIRGMVMVATGSRIMVLDGNESTAGKFTATGPDDQATISGNRFKLVISSSAGSSFGSDDGIPGVKIYSASLNPSDDDYYAKVLNNDPDKFASLQHYLYADFPVDDEIATPTLVAVMSGSANKSSASGDTSLAFRSMFGAFDTRYQTAQSTWIISQPYGSTEFDLFKVEALDDGEFANTLFKVSVANLRASTSNDPYGTFTLNVRAWDDSDKNPRVLESFNNLSLNPSAPNYIAKVIGDRKTYFNFDADDDAERRFITTGKYANVSKYIRVVMNQAVEDAKVPVSVLPFGFRGPELLKTNDVLENKSSTALPDSQSRLGGILNASNLAFTGSLLPPLPLRTKVTDNDVATSAGYQGNPGTYELANVSLHWGIKFDRTTTPLSSNASGEQNKLLESFAKFMGIKKLDALVTGSAADTFNNNKFTLARVALANQAISDLTGSITDHMREAAYIRNGVPNSSTYAITDGGLSRLTFASLLSQGGAVTFNNFNAFAKFTTMVMGGFDGVNILDRDSRRLNDKSTSFSSPGGASSTYVPTGFSANVNGTGQNNNSVWSYQKAVDIMTDRNNVLVNTLTIPGVRESYITDYTAKKVKDYGLAMYIMDIPSYDDSSSRLYDDSTTKPNVSKTIAQFAGRNIDNNYTATYFPDVIIDDASRGNRKVKVASSVAALGALSFNDKQRYVWFAPAGFNRASLDFVSNVAVRLNSSDRDSLYDNRINPIATFPREGFVIYGQKTLQLSKSALDRVNVRRLLLEVKRLIIDIAEKLVFEQNTPAVRNRFVADAVIRLGLIQAQAGIEAFQVVMNETNNTQTDIDQNRLNGRVVIVPTRAIEFIAIDFVVTNNGVNFV